MSQKDFFEQCGLTGFYERYESMMEVSAPKPTTTKWNGQSLLSGRCYRVVAEDEKSLDEKLKEKLSSLDDVLFISTTNGWGTSINCEKYYVDGVEVVEELLNLRGNDNIKVVVVSPGSRLVFSDPQFASSSMGFVMERIRLIMNKYIDSDVFMIIADLDMYDGRSDSRRVLAMTTEETLK